jgi:subtilisin family serine protease
VVVGATGQDGRKTWWSDYGKYIDVTAPGENIYTSVLNGYDYVNGTSFSAPMTAGVAALMYRDTSLFDLEMRLRTNNTWNQNLGWGIIDASKVVRPHSPVMEVA